MILAGLKKTKRSNLLEQNEIQLRRQLNHCFYDDGVHCLRSLWYRHRIYSRYVWPGRRYLAAIYHTVPEPMRRSGRHPFYWNYRPGFQDYMLYLAEQRVWSGRCTAYLVFERGLWKDGSPILDDVREVSLESYQFPTQSFACVTTHTKTLGLRTLYQLVSVRVLDMY